MRLALICRSWAGMPKVRATFVHRVNDAEAFLPQVSTHAGSMGARRGAGVGRQPRHQGTSSLLQQVHKPVPGLLIFYSGNKVAQWHKATQHCIDRAVASPSTLQLCTRAD